MGYSGDTQIELMEITSDTPSPYADADGKPLLGPHHVAWLTDDLDASLAEAKAAGQEVLFQAEGPGTRVAYVHSPNHPGPIFEYIQTEGMREMIKYGIEQTRNWDGHRSHSRTGIGENCCWRCDCTVRPMRDSRTFRSPRWPRAR
jgi:catechol 2,3-dioxygenase-like lactoylglutathione lyase family enzyme